MSVSSEVLKRFTRVLVEEIRAKRPEYLREPFTVAEIYQDLAPYGSCRDRIGIEINGDYEDALLRLLAGEGDFLALDSEPALRDLRAELATAHPNTGVYREFAAVDVRLGPSALALTGEEGAGAVTAPRGASPGAVPPPVAAPTPGGVPQAVATPDLPGPWSAPGAPPPTSVGVGAPSGEACRWCRAPLPTREGLRFCPFCGSDARLVPCQQCGQELEPEWRFCIACGHEASG